ncbi:MAG: sodium/glutamate symporter [Opitutus sp.]|nr:sodium/glutamate symporter [Opitutus sp.]
MNVMLSPWCLLLLAVPVLLAGENVVRRVPLLARCNLPVPVVGGLLFSALLLGLNLAGLAAISFSTKVSAGWWTWLVTPEIEWFARPAKNLNLPLLVAFFTCIGLGAPVRVLRSGGRALFVLLAGATVLAVVQNLVGVALARALDAPPLLGVVCGALTLVGGHGTALGFAARFEEAGLAGAATMGAAAATLALVAGGVLAGPLGEWLLRGRDAKFFTGAPAAPSVTPANFFHDGRALAASGRAALGHALILAACVKAGAWVSLALDRAGLALPAYMGALLVGFAVRAAHDGLGATWLRADVIARLAAVLLPLFLAVTLAALNLAELTAVAGPMLVILTVNIAVSLAFAALVIWPLLGRDHEAGVMTAGLVGFGVGSTATAVAAMDAITRRRGPAPRAFAIVPPTGGFLIDLTNAPVITAFINLCR